jgi:hemerythrin-like domain-containing protein
MKITDALFAEHVVFHNLLDYIEATVPRSRNVIELRTLAALLKSLLEAHSRVEDELVIGPLEHCMDQLGQHDGFHEEHEEIDGNLREALRGRSLRSVRRSLLAAVASSRHHFDKEERILFPMAEKILKADTLKSLGATWMKQREAQVPATTGPDTRP